MFKVFFEDVIVGDKKEFGHYEVTKQEVIDFASKYDPQPFHLDEEAAKNSVFGVLCASGWHTSAMTMAMVVKDFTQTGLAGMGSPGLDFLNWHQPVKVGDTLSVITEAVEKRESKSRPNLGFLKNKITTLNEKGETVMTMQANVMVLKRPVD